MRPIDITVRRLRTVGLAVLVLSANACGSVKKINPDGYPIPDIEKATVAWVKKFDKAQDIPGRETKGTLYRYGGNDGGHLLTYEYEGKIYAVLLDHDRTYPANYALLDLDCDGKFETKISSSAEVWIPDCLRGKTKNPF